MMYTCPCMPNIHATIQVTDITFSHYFFQYCLISKLPQALVLYLHVIMHCAAAATVRYWLGT